MAVRASIEPEAREPSKKKLNLSKKGEKDESFFFRQSKRWGW